MPFPQVLTFSGGAKTVRLVGHRGARGLLPETSMIGFDSTLSSDQSTRVRRISLARLRARDYP